MAPSSSRAHKYRDVTCTNSICGGRFSPRWTWFVRIASGPLSPVVCEGKQMSKSNSKKWLRASGMAVVATAALVVGFANPAAADPVTKYVAAGSDTTQDVMDQFAILAGGGLVGSWDAVNPTPQAPHQLIRPKPGCGVTRPNGSGEGPHAPPKWSHTS